MNQPQRALSFLASHNALTLAIQYLFRLLQLGVGVCPLRHPFDLLSDGFLRQRARARVFRTLLRGRCLLLLALTKGSFKIPPHSSRRNIDMSQTICSQTSDGSRESSIDTGTSNNEFQTNSLLRARRRTHQQLLGFRLHRLRGQLRGSGCGRRRRAEINALAPVDAVGPRVGGRGGGRSPDQL